MERLSMISKKWMIIVENGTLVLVNQNQMKHTFLIQDIVTFEIHKPVFWLKGYIQIQLKNQKKPEHFRGEMPPAFISLISKEEYPCWKAIEQSVRQQLKIRLH
ncbi:hypothetical protein [Desmospora activa]|uniref:PH (Pleckstrin Homology) domain-containing protein n=1 Tax=Desmospora activa DSM 45169 TaxID=1121389 RepID=A0A2T4Z6Y1_9BACL|nr:hypothetical protein [Desmospora activa]PTM57652.1 hypothetical protein C8J48_0202 [Desmospora activa DSM 45169]